MFFQVLGLSLTVCQLLFLLLRLIMQLISQRFSVEESWLFRKDNTKQQKCLNLDPFQTIRYIILPQVVKIVLPSIFNEIINLVKDSSLVYVLGVGDLLLEVVPLRTVMRP